SVSGACARATRSSANPRPPCRRMAQQIIESGIDVIADCPQLIPAAEKTDVRRRLPQRVMAGLDPAIPTSTGIAKEAVTSCNGAGGDGRVKPGHDALERSAVEVRQYFRPLVLDARAGGSR